MHKHIGMCADNGRQYSVALIEAETCEYWLMPVMGNEWAVYRRMRGDDECVYMGASKTIERIDVGIPCVIEYERKGEKAQTAMFVPLRMGMVDVLSIPTQKKCG